MRLESKLGDEIKYFCRTKWASQKRAAKVIGVSESILSQVVKGTRNPSKELMMRLIDSGFSEDHFKEHFLGEKRDLTMLTTKELIEFAYQQQSLIDSYKDLVNFLSKRIDKLSK